MTKIVILDQKQIVPNDYQQFWVHFDWFLSLFQTSDVKYLLSLFKLKVHKNCTAIFDSGGLQKPLPLMEGLRPK